MKNQFAGLFDNPLNLSKENIKTWIVTYVNSNNNILSLIAQAREEKFIDIEK